MADQIRGANPVSPEVVAERLKKERGRFCFSGYFPDEMKKEIEMERGEVFFSYRFL